MQHLGIVIVAGGSFDLLMASSEGKWILMDLEFFRCYFLNLFLSIYLFFVYEDRFCFCCDAVCCVNECCFVCLLCFRV